jgi:DNA polymerase-3 subunit alpha
LRDAFEPGAFFVELQNHGFPEQRPLNETLVELAHAMDLPLVATNDCHYLERKHAHAQLVLQCIAAGVGVDEMRRGRHASQELYLKSPHEMRQAFRDVTEAVTGTMLVAEMCAGTADPLAAPVLPRFPVPSGLDENGYFQKLAEDGLTRRLDALRRAGQTIDEPAYRERLAMECQVIRTMGFAGYFLIVQDVVNWARDRGIPVGPGRGSGAGSLVAYAMACTDLDPIRYGLLFERFLNPERVSMPDFDMDFCMDRRGEVIDYVREKYGRQSVGQIATFHLLRSRSVVRDVGRVMGMTPQDAGRIATMVPEPVQGKAVAIADALAQEKRLREASDGDPKVKELLDTAMSLENLNRHAGMHAAGVVISEGPLWDHVPVFCPEPDVYVTQYDKGDVEAAGLVKFDVLGLKTLTILDIAGRLIARRPDRAGAALALDALPLDDAATYALLQSGETTGVFQLESSGMQALIKRLKPDSFDDLIALVALYRPGPLGSGMVEDYVEGKHGRKRVQYPHPSLEGILKETFGVMVYQEQVMQTAQEMAGYTLGQADVLRNAMSKKKDDEMASQKVHFMAGARERGHGSEQAETVFELMKYFSGYGFNKSHSAAYALIAYQCAYLKAHYPVEFLCATMSADRDHIERVVRTVTEARAMGITVLPPDVNESDIDFTVVYKPDASVTRDVRQPAAFAGRLRDPAGPRIRFGLGAVKGVGAAALEVIFTARKGDDGTRPFSDLFDFGSRVDLRRVNKGVVDALVQCGAMDTMHEPLAVGRERVFAAIDLALERGRQATADRESGQTDLFGMLRTDVRTTATRPVFPEARTWERKERLAREKATLGFYVSGHPLDGCRAELERFCNCNTATLAHFEEGARAVIGGVVEDLRIRPMRTGGRVGFFQLEDPFGRVEVIVRERALDKCAEILRGDAPILVTGTVRPEQNRGGNEGGDADETDMKLLLDEATPLADAFRARAKSVCVSVHVDRLDRAKLIELRRTLEDFPGRCPVELQLLSDTAWTVKMATAKIQVDPTEALLERLEGLFGEKVCELR